MSRPSHSLLSNVREHTRCSSFQELTAYGGGEGKAETTKNTSIEQGNSIHRAGRGAEGTAVWREAQGRCFNLDVLVKSIRTGDPHGGT